jgi:site-specific DNA-methyltransferase (adenine-specific)
MAVVGPVTSLRSLSTNVCERCGAKLLVESHATVKPIALMRWLCRLVTPPNGLILDPFNGSGSTGCAAVLEGFRYLGAELDADYVEIARKRIAHWASQTPEPDLFG